MASADPCSDVTLAILAGGEGSRLGVPKALLRVNDRPILEHLHVQLSWPGPTLVVTAPGRERPPGAERLDREAVDPVAGQGPLRGILTALENARTPLVVVTAVDMPLVDAAHLRELITAFSDCDDVLGLMARRRGERQVQPIPGAFHRDSAEVIRQRLDVDDRSIVRLTHDARFIVIDVNWNPIVWQSLNTPADAERMRAQNLRITGFQPVLNTPARLE